MLLAAYGAVAYWGVPVGRFDSAVFTPANRLLSFPNFATNDDRYGTDILSAFRILHIVLPMVSFWFSRS